MIEISNATSRAATREKTYTSGFPQPEFTNELRPKKGKESKERGI